MIKRLTYSFLLCLILISSNYADEIKNLVLKHSDRLEVVPSASGQIWYAVGNVEFEVEDGIAQCDSAVWVRGREIILRGNSKLENSEYYLAADSIHYDLNKRLTIAEGQHVELWIKKDSIYASGQYAFHERDSDVLIMDRRPTLFLHYPDTSKMIEIIADEIYFDSKAERAEASGNVRISSQDLSSKSGCAIMNTKKNILDLFEDPVAIRGRSELSGELISITSIGDEISQIDVLDSATGTFTEPTDSTEVAFDRSILKGQRIIFSFKDGELSKIGSFGQAYSWYYPSDYLKSEAQENSISGDTIWFDIFDESLQSMQVVGGAIGAYLDKKYRVRDNLNIDSSDISNSDSISDSLLPLTVYYDTIVDTINYQAHTITYDLTDSVIRLEKYAHVESDDVELNAHEINIDTRSDVLYAFSADVLSDSIDDSLSLTSGLQPNPIPVRLKDKDDILYGDYLEYSIETEKGRIVQSKSKYESGFFYGDKLYREQKEVFYLNDGRYTTCDADEPHFHFHSQNIKLMHNNKMIAKPVVLNIGRFPLLAIPYYIFPLQKGRRSGILPFTFGNIERGDRYLQNVGYYWAASEYWDWQGAIDYYERSSRLNFNSRINYAKRYTFSGSVNGNYARESSFNSFTGTENKSTRWSIRGNHSHELSPSFKINGSGQLQSDASFFNDYSTDLQERLNRTVRSEVNFRKSFSRSVTLSGAIKHDENLDTESRTDQLPSLALSLPTLKPFGSGGLDEDGKRKTSWYNNLVVTYRPNMLNFSNRVTNKEAFLVSVDTLITVDSLITIDTVNNVTDTIITEDTTFTDITDTTSNRSRKKYTRINHPISISFPSKIARYITFNPSFSYREEWYQVYETDQSLDQGINSGSYRAYSYSTSAQVSTKLYGTVNPNVFGLLGLRQVLTPTVNYRFTPEINRHPEVRSYVGGSAGSSRKSQTMTFTLNQLYQAKVKKGSNQDKVFSLVSITSSFSYNFEEDERKFSNLNTSFNSTVLPKVNFYGSMVHSLYKPGTNDLDFFSPYLESFTINASLSITGRNFLFTENIPSQSSSQTTTDNPYGGSPIPPTGGGFAGSGSSGRWSLTANYSYRESGRGENFRKSSFIRFNLNFNLTPQTTVAYSQYYDISSGETVSNQVSIVRKLHCWTGSLVWVPIGSTRGWGFRIFVTDIPQIKIDQSQNQLSSGYLFNQ